MSRGLVTMGRDDVPTNPSHATAAASVATTNARDERARCPVEPTSMSELTGQPRGEPGDAQPDANED